METERVETPSADAPKTCPQCQGRGWMDNLCVTEARERCCSFCDGKGVDAGGKECYACHGTGLIEVRVQDKLACTLCHGAGIHPVPESLTATEFAYRP